MNRRALLVPLALALGALAGTIATTVAARADEPKAEAPPKFSHAAHIASAPKSKLDVAKCATCHAVDADGKNVPPGTDGHQPCMASGCHLDDFLTKDSTFCLGCHASSDNFRKNPPVNVFKNNPAPEHYMEFSHQAHMRPSVAGSKAEAVVCQTCHWVDKATFRAIERPGHPQCAPCHVGAKSVPMSRCEGCHMDGDPKTHFTKHRPDVSLKDNFAHEHVGHRFFDKDKMTQPIQCETCHYKVEKFATLLELKAAPIIDTNTMKNNCAKCHDVRDTGKCTVCHTKSTIASQATFNYHGL